MLSRMSIRRNWVLLALLAFASCSDAPQPIVPMRFGGELHLQGGLATTNQGAIYLIVRNVGDGTPVLARRYELGEAQLKATERVLTFNLDRTNLMTMPGSPAPELRAETEIEARYDKDGNIGTKNDIIQTTAPASSGDMSLVLTLKS